MHTAHLLMECAVCNDVMVGSELTAVNMNSM